MAEEDKNKDSILDNIYQKQIEDEMVNIAYDNSYKILIGEITFDSLLEEATDELETALVGFDPECGPSKSELENMILWYEQYEEYERCAKLHTILINKYSRLVDVSS
jgi:hypothetical protein